MGNATEVLEQLRAYTNDVMKFHGLKLTDTGKNSHGAFAENQPSGFIYHYTASPRSKTKKRPYGRSPVLLERFKPGSKQRVGVQFIIMDDPYPRLKEIKDKYPLIRDIPAEVYFMGGDEAYWHAGSANRWAWGVEIRNVGQVQQDTSGNFFYNRGKYRWRGRAPIHVGSDHWEPYTRSQMIGAVWILRLAAELHPLIPERVLGHTHVSNTRIDPGLHFPIHSMREFGLWERDIPLEDMPFLSEFGDDSGEDVEDVLVSEEELHAGLYRHDWDGDAGTERIEAVFDFTEEEVEDIRSDDPDHAEVVKAKEDLRSIGYYVGTADGTMSKSFIETLRIFQGRWKVKKGKRWVHDPKIPVNGRLTEETKSRITMMVRQVDRM